MIVRQFTIGDLVISESPSPNSIAVSIIKPDGVAVATTIEKDDWKRIADITTNSNYRNEFTWYE